MKNSFYAKYVKRFLDIIISGAGLLVLSPLLLILAVLVRKRLGSPVIYSQQRPGLRDPETGQEKIFRLCKFRSMTDAVDENGQPLSDEARITPFGAKLRATSLDELPELWNIFKGDMSVIGPRPLLVRYLPRYSEEQRRRHDVRPGLTGLAQINGRNAISWEEKFRYDTAYVDGISFGLDVKIFFGTVRAVFKHEGINAADGSFTEEFMGSEKHE